MIVLIVLEDHLIEIYWHFSEGIKFVSGSQFNLLIN